MANKKTLKNLYLIFSLVLSIVFFVLEQNHDCSGDGCLICLSSSIINYVTEALLLINFVPVIFEKVCLFFRLAYSNIASKEFGKKEYKPIYLNPINIEGTDLISFGVKIQ